MFARWRRGERQGHALVIRRGSHRRSGRVNGPVISPALRADHLLTVGLIAPATIPSPPLRLLRGNYPLPPLPHPFSRRVRTTSSGNSFRAARWFYRDRLL